MLKVAKILLNISVLFTKPLVNLEPSKIMINCRTNIRESLIWW